jgi:uncharacterized protein (DUF885 family)
MTPRGRMPGVLAHYEKDRDGLLRKYPLEMSAARQARMTRFYTDWLAALEPLDFDALDQDDRADYLLFKNHLQHELRRMDIRAQNQAEIAPLAPFTQTVLDLAEARQRMEPVDPAKAAASLNALSLHIKQVRGKVETKLAEKQRAQKRLYRPTVANRAARMVERLQEILKHWFTFYDGYDPLFTWWAEEPYQESDQALQGYAAFLKEQIVGVKPEDEGAIIGDPIGREALLVELAYEMIPYSPEELIAIAKRELAWCEAEMKRAAQDLGCGDWHQALEQVKTLHVEPGRQPELIRDLALEAIAFLDRHDLITIPPLARETWRMEMMSPERQKVNPFFLGGETIQVSFPTNAMTYEQKQMSLRGNNAHFARATVHHELIPGHHLQGFMMERYRPYRRVFSTSFWIEGWPLHWEMLLWDMGFAESPENRIGMLFWRMHRCARILFSLGFHLERMSPQECIDFLVERVGHERANATAEVRRSFQGDYRPLYQCAYLLGGLQMRALHHELVGSGRMTNRAFHDAVLRENSIPIEMLRARLTGETLPRDFASGWKFYGPVTGETRRQY